MEALLTILEEYPDDYAQNNSHPKPRKGYFGSATPDPHTLCILQQNKGLPVSQK